MMKSVLAILLLVSLVHGRNYLAMYRRVLNVMD